MLNRRKRFDSSLPDPFNALLFVVLHLLVIFQLFTGFQLYVYGLESGYSVIGTWWPSLLHLSTDWTLTLFGGIGGVRLAHHTMMYPIIVWAILHIYYEVWRTVVWKEGDITISFGGYKLGRVEPADKR
jgi:Ni/Fe-hydrogenase 1 B-type cytochrome subunit